MPLSRGSKAWQSKRRPVRGRVVGDLSCERCCPPRDRGGRDQSSSPSDGRAAGPARAEL